MNINDVAMNGCFLYMLYLLTREHSLFKKSYLIVGLPADLKKDLEKHFTKGTVYWLIMGLMNFAAHIFVRTLPGFSTGIIKPEYYEYLFLIFGILSLATAFISGVLRDQIAVAKET